MRTTNPIESTFATVRLRQRVTKGPGSRAAGIATAFKLIESAQARADLRTMPWRARPRLEPQYVVVSDGSGTSLLLIRLPSTSAVNSMTAGAFKPSSALFCTNTSSDPIKAPV